MKKLDLRDGFGKDHLSSALGVGTDSVGALWKQLKEYPENKRQLALETLAEELSGHYSPPSMYAKNDDPPSKEELTNKYRIHPSVIEALVSYYETNLEPVMQPSTEPPLQSLRPYSDPYSR